MHGDRPRARRASARRPSTTDRSLDRGTDVLPPGTAHRSPWIRTSIPPDTRALPPGSMRVSTGGGACIPPDTDIDPPDARALPPGRTGRIHPGKAVDEGGWVRGRRGVAPSRGPGLATDSRPSPWGA